MKLPHLALLLLCLATPALAQDAESLTPSEPAEIPTTPAEPAATEPKPPPNPPPASETPSPDQPSSEAVQAATPEQVETFLAEIYNPIRNYSLPWLTDHVRQGRTLLRAFPDRA
ncbi:MAG: hypothetical protein SNJ84_03665, partial [Verrucomicrobiia bacterium]